MSEPAATHAGNASQAAGSARATISVIIPTLNGAALLRELLAALSIQSLQPDEVMVFDSSSEDETVQVAEQYGAVVTVIQRHHFDHGATRSMAARSAVGELLVFFTQDVLPAHRRVLENLVAPLQNNAHMAMTYGRQLPAFDASATAAHLRLFNYPETSAVRTFADRSVLGLETVFASNSCAAYRKSDLASVGFFKSGLIFGEDTCAAGRLLQHGFTVGYAADAAVYHSHNYSWTEEFRRYFDVGVLHEMENWLLETYGNAEGRGRKYFSSGISYLVRHRRYSLIADFVVRSALKYLGYRLGRNFRKLPGRLIPELSMHRRWWDSRNL